MAYDPTSDPSSWQYDRRAHPGAPSKGTPDDLFPHGVPLRGPLTPAQERWLHDRRN